MAWLLAVGALAFEHETNPEHTVHVAGIRPASDAFGFDWTNGFILAFHGSISDSYFARSFSAWGGLELIIYCLCRFPFGHGFFADSIPVRSLFSRAAGITMKHLVRCAVRVKSLEPASAGAGYSAARVDPKGQLVAQLVDRQKAIYTI